ncbi:MAG: hypothetical protein EAZ76_02575 [Nostocales cyanobacterium]|nr:MAG: hypothetical protein EAZ87_18640 [Nostocales cyanobacterium]TAF19867.1 MAG: hypothetical protein EAZ76_02575 [Nostocales cyanobacterium]
MKPGLKRIEATLHDLGTHNHQLPSETNEGKKRGFSFRISVDKNKAKYTSHFSEKQDNNTTDTNTSAQNFSQSQSNQNSQHHPVQAFSTPAEPGKTPNLPKFKTPNFSNHRHGANPAFAMTLLQEIQETVANWQTELQTILEQIQNIYLEGQVINGWLESTTAQGQETPGTATLRHGEVEQLLNYVQEICETSQTVSHPSSRTGYRLCGVDADGKVWSRPCSVHEVPSVSVAIARYQKLRQLFARKQYLENRLSQLAETLVNLHSNIQHP